MNNHNNHIVVTTINPFDKISHQIQCFKSWKEIGYNIKSFNCKEEATILIKNGMSEDDIVFLDIDETSYKFNQKYQPKIKSIVEKIAKYNCNCIIVNSDIYAFHNQCLIDILPIISSSLAFCRTECLDLACSNIANQKFYQNGLDIFFFTKECIHTLNNELQKIHNSEYMYFGIPGWDFLIATIIHCKLNGFILNGPIFGHKYHKNTYSKLDGFEHYCNIVAQLNNIQEKDINNIAFIFKEIIHQECMRNLIYTNKLKLFFNNNVIANTKISHNNSQITQLVNLLEKKSLLKIDIVKLYFLIDNLLHEKDWQVTKLFYNDIFTHTLPNTAKLFIAISFIILNEKINFVNSYPPNNLHSRAVNLIMDTSQNTNNDFLDLFLEELLIHKIFNSYIYDYLVLGANDDVQLYLYKTLLTKIEENLNV